MFLQAPEKKIRVILVLSKIHGDTVLASQGLPPVSTTPVANLPPTNLPPVSTTPAVNLPLVLLVSLILVANNGNNIRLLTP